MPKSNKDTTQIFRSLGPDNSNDKLAINSSVREAEHRWPMLKSTPPKKFEQIPDLTDDEKIHWLSTKKTKSGGRKNALSVPSSTSNEKLAESLKKMAGATIKSKPVASRNKSLITNEIVEIKKTVQTPSIAGVEEVAELKKIAQIRKVAEIKPEFEEGRNIEAEKVLEVNNSPSSKRVAKLTATRVKTKVEASKSLRGIFDRLKGKQSEVVPAPATPVKSSVLSKLSKR